MSTSRELQPNQNDRCGIGATYNRGGQDNNCGGRSNRGGRGYHGGRITNQGNQWSHGSQTQYGWGNQNQDGGYLDLAMLSSMTPGQCRMYFIGQEQV